MIFHNCDVEITESRWEIDIYITEKSGNKTHLVASADSFFSEHDHIWFSTIEEMDKYWNENR